MTKTMLLLIASNARSLAEQAEAAASGESITPDVVGVIRRSFLNLKNACAGLANKRK